MTSDHLTDATDIADALRSRMRSGQGLSVPYARKWDVGGCQATHSLRTYPYDGITVFSIGLAGLGQPIIPTDDGLLIGDSSNAWWVATNRSTRGDGPPDAYLVGRHQDQRAQYTGNAPEVVIELLQKKSEAAPNLSTTADLQIGFPGLEDSHATYVGSWQWNIHGEARDDEFVRRAAAATLATIQSKKEEEDAEHSG